VEQNTQVALSAANYGYVLERGMVVLEGEVNFLRETPHVKQAYLGF
jgi:branched-chain amino acid transport system ATP-binding protein